MHCLYPDCSFTTKTDSEADKRLVVDHINNAHDDAHVLIACAHDMQHVEYFTTTTRSGDTGAELTLDMERLRCPRCGQFEVRGAEEGEGGE